MSQNKQPLITIIIAVYNGGRTLQQCIDSVVSQSYTNTELIVIDGDSTDETKNIIESNLEAISYMVSEPDNGIYNAWNKGVAKSNGDWICFLGADDFFWDPEVLKTVTINLLKIPQHILVAYGKIKILNNDDICLYEVGESWEVSGPRFSKVMSITHPGAMHKRELFEKYGFFDESYRIAGDYELLLRHLKSNHAYFMDVVMVGMRLGGISSNIDYSLLQLKEVRAAQVKHGLKWPSCLWVMAMIRVYIRMIIWNALGETKARKVLDLGRSITGKPLHWTRN